MKFILISIALFSIIRAESQNIAQNDSLQNPKSVLDSPVKFLGWKGNLQTTKLINEFRIGLFLPSDSLNRSNQSLINAANMAIDEINSSDEDNAVPYKLINRWSSDPWGAGSKEMIKLVYVDSVIAVVGSIDGDATHIAEQITTKARLPLLSPISADPTLTYIRVPWIFRLPPDYKAQAEVIIHEGIANERMKKVGLITENTHDGRIFAEEVNNGLENYQISFLFHFEVSKSNLDFHSIVRRIISFDPYSIIVCLSKDNIIKLLSELRNSTKNIEVMLPWVPGFDYNYFNQYDVGTIYYVEPFLRSSNLLYEKFADKYRRFYKSDPSFGAAYTYDALHLLMSALQKSGPNRAKLRDAITGMNGYEGVTGKIIWDNGGGNTARPILRKVRHQERNQE
jgi:branched-chain amino acid transport system substrate-binding protein